MFSRRMLLALVAMFAMTASSAFAGGGGGTKKDSTIIIKNESNATVGVIVDAPAAALAPATTPIQFYNLGGRFLNPNDSATFKVKSGSHEITVVGGIAAAAPFVQDQQTKVVGKGATLNGVVVKATGFLAF